MIHMPMPLTIQGLQICLWGHLACPSSRQLAEEPPFQSPKKAWREPKQSYNCQAVVDNKAQVILASGVTQQTNDKLQVKPLIKTLMANAGKVPEKLSADAGYFSEDNCSFLQTQKINAFIATEKTNMLANAEAPRGRIPKNASITERMTRKLQTIKGRLVYAKRKHIVEPVFGQIKEARQFRRFSFRGLKNVSAEWDIVCLTHNLLKLYRSGWRPLPT